MSNHFERGLALIEVKRWDLAEIEFRRVLAETPDHAYAHANLSYCLNNVKGRSNEALSEADEAVRLAPEDVWCHVRRGDALNQLRRFREAEPEANEAIRLDPTDIDGYRLLAEVMSHRIKPLKTLLAADKGLAICPTDLDCLRLRSDALSDLHRMDMYYETAASAVALHPDKAEAHATLGWYCFYAESYLEARDHFLEALRLKPDFEWARLGLVCAKSPLVRGYHRVRWLLRTVFIDWWR